MWEERKIYLLSPTEKAGTVPLPMITFSLKAEHLEFGQCDTLMFTSKQAVISADSIDTAWKNYPCIAIGPATKKQIEDLGGEVLYHPKAFYGSELAGDIIKFFKERKILYLRPKEVSFDSKAYLSKAGIVLQEQVIYQTDCILYENEKKPKKGAVIIFTSPSTIHCFFKSFTWDESYTAVLIGKASQAHLPEGVDYVLAEVPLISACIEKAQKIIEKL